MSSPEFHFLGSGFSDAPDILDSPKCYLSKYSSHSDWESDLLDLSPSTSIPDAIDRFFSELNSGMVAGWISYDAGVCMNGLDLNEDRGYNHVPLLWLGQFENSPVNSRESKNPSGGVPDLGPLTSDVSREEYCRRIRIIHRLIRRGYVYQINYSQRFSGNCIGTIRGLIDRDDSLLPPHSVYFRHDDQEVLSLSPERFFRIEGDRIITQPIKGTRPRKMSDDSDDRVVSDLKKSDKDEAEHVMIVDLERNDLNRICEVGTVGVSELKSHYQYETVHHLVSTVTGKLKEQVTPGRIFEALFPGGSITGAPKTISIRLINHIEQRRRGIYTGSIGYFDLDRNVADWNIAIRTLVRSSDRAWWDAGGGIVIDSDPNKEYSESLDKIELLNRVLENNPKQELEPSK